MKGEAGAVWQVVRACCTSGMCISCRAEANGTKRRKVLHADHLTEAVADRMVAGWAAYGARKERMP